MVKRMDPKMEVRTSDEIQTLGEDFNHMIGALKK